MNRFRIVRRAAAAAWLSLALGAVGGTAAGGQNLITSQSELVYVGTQLGVPVDGSFSRFQAQVNLDPARLQSSSVSFSVDTSSVDFPAEDIRRELAKPDWLDTARFPSADFKSSRIRDLGGRRYEITGTLTIKGHAHEVTFPISLSQSGSTTFATGELSIKRLEYGIGQGEWGDTSLVEDAVRIKFKIALTGMPPA